jgi:hypothetical protein
MAQYNFIHALHLLVATSAGFVILVLDFMMIAEVRRKRLPKLMGWLVPATISATMAVMAYLFGDVRLWLGLRETLSAYEFTATLGMVACLLTSWAAVGLWRMICQLPPGNQPSIVQDSPGERPDIWPPPPVRRT